MVWWSMNDAKVRELANTYNWNLYVFARSGRNVRRFGLIFQRGDHQDVQFCTLDEARGPEEVGSDLEQGWERNKGPEEPLIRYIRAVEIEGLGAQHIMVRLPTSSSEGELFRCVRCGCIRTGRPCFGDGTFWSPYRMITPQITTDNRRGAPRNVNARSGANFTRRVPAQPR